MDTFTLFGGYIKKTSSVVGLVSGRLCGWYGGGGRADAVPLSGKEPSWVLDEGEELWCEPEESALSVYGGLSDNCGIRAPCLRRREGRDDTPLEGMPASCDVVSMPPGLLGYRISMTRVCEGISCSISFSIPLAFRVEDPPEGLHLPSSNVRRRRTLSGRCCLILLSSVRMDYEK